MRAALGFPLGLGQQLPRATLEAIGAVELSMQAAEITKGGGSRRLDAFDERRGFRLVLFSGKSRKQQVAIANLAGRAANPLETASHFVRRFARDEIFVEIDRGRCPSRRDAELMDPFRIGCTVSCGLREPLADGLQPIIEHRQGDVDDLFLVPCLDRLRQTVHGRVPQRRLMRLHTNRAPVGN